MTATALFPSCPVLLGRGPCVAPCRRRSLTCLATPPAEAWQLPPSAGWPSRPVFGTGARGRLGGGADAAPWVPGASTDLFCPHRPETSTSTSPWGSQVNAARTRVGGSLGLGGAGAACVRPSALDGERGRRSVGCRVSRGGVGGGSGRRPCLGAVSRLEVLTE